MKAPDLAGPSSRHSHLLVWFKVLLPFAGSYFLSYIYTALSMPSSLPTS